MPALPVAGVPIGTPAARPWAAAAVGGHQCRLIALPRACRCGKAQRVLTSLVCFWRTASLLLAPLHGFLVQSYQWWTLRIPTGALRASLQIALALRLCVLVWLAGARLHAGRIAGPHVCDDAAWIAATVHHPVQAAPDQSRSRPAASQSAVHRKLDIGSLTTPTCVWCLVQCLGQASRPRQAHRALLPVLRYAVSPFLVQLGPRFFSVFSCLL